jgi:hypothetical protein
MILFQLKINPKKSAQLRLEFMILALAAFFGFYAFRNVPVQGQMIREIKTHLSGLDNGERRIKMFYSLPAREIHYCNFFELINDIKSKTSDSARIGFYWNQINYLTRFIPYYLFRRHAFLIKDMGEQEAKEKHNLDYLVHVNMNPKKWKWKIKDVR